MCYTYTFLSKFYTFTQCVKNIVKLIYTDTQCKSKSICMHNTALDLHSKFKYAFWNYSIELHFTILQSLSGSEKIT
jgi:hypothetical protein